MRYEPEANTLPLISNPVSAALRWIMCVAPLSVADVGDVSSLVGKHCQSFTFAPVNPVGIAGVGNSVGKVSDIPVTVEPATAYVSEISLVTIFPTRV